jgi:RNase H-like domain found in reverse transcriptase/Reverse transcriptase (RNA-dependent DNA polymerase)/Integrase zinc binding domain/gag-polyprotein putative aspartyl protease
VHILTQDVILSLSSSDLYDSHTAIRHLAEVDPAGHTVDVTLPLTLRKHRAFTPWLTAGRTVGGSKRTLPVQHQQVIMTFSQPLSQPVHYHGPFTHKASFDVRVGGAVVRTLFDTGATVSVVSRRFLNKFGISYQKDKSSGHVDGFGGGSIATIGTAMVPVKLGKHQPVHLFQVIPDADSGYDCILGDDFLHPYGISIGYHAQVVKAKMYVDTPKECIALQRKIAPPPSTPQVCTFASTPDPDPSKPGSWKELKSLNHDISAGKQVAYRIHLLSKGDAAGNPESLSGLPPEIQSVIQKHSGPGGTLAGTIPPHTHAIGFECHIELLEGAKPVYIRQYRLTPLEKEELITRVQEFIAKGWIEPSSSCWSSSVLFAPKPNGKLRFCVDFRHLNARTAQNKGPIPNQGELLDSLHGSSVFSALDLASGFYQIAMAQDSKAVTAFPTPFGLYQWCVMPMGLCNAPAIFQQAMNTILRDHILGGYCKVYLDDVVIMSKDMATHAEHLDKVLTSLHQHNLFCQLPKCTWAQPQLRYLGHIVSGQGVAPDPSKVKALDSWDPPVQLVAQLAAAQAADSQKEATQLQEQIATQCRRFLGFMNYFNRFIPRYSDMACDLHGHTQKNPPVWTQACTDAWNQLKTCLKRATMMYHPDFSLPFHVYSDASTKAIGGVLIQFQDDVAHPVAYVARKLTSAEVNYTTTEQEMLAFVYCFAQWRCYLEGSQVFLHSDHEPLTWLATQERPNRRQARWLEFLAGFSYRILYVKGDENVVADALSRMLSPPDDVQFQLPGDGWPLHVPSCSQYDADQVPNSRSCSVYSISLDDAATGRSPTGSAYPRPGSPGSVRRADGVGIPPPLSASAGRKPGTPVAARMAAGGARDGTGCGALTVSPGDLQSPFHRYILLGGYTRRTGQLEAAPGVSKPSQRDRHGADQSAGGEVVIPAKRTRGTKSAVRSAKRVAFADSVRLHNDSNYTTASEPDFSTDPQPVSAQPAAGSVSRGQEISASEPTVDTHEPPVSSSGDVTPPELGQPAGVATSLAPELDPSLSAYELLAEQLFDRIRSCLKTDTAVQSESQLHQYQLKPGKGDLLWRGNLLYVPKGEGLRQDILHWHHDVPWCGHLGIQKTLELVRRQFWWPGMSADIKDYVQSCFKCQSDKLDRRLRRPPLTFIEAPSSCWRTMGVDLIVDLTPTEPDGYNAILVFMCFLSKMVRLVATHSTLTTAGFVELFFKEVFPHYGMPTKIVSDRGPQWNSEFFRALCDKADIRLSLSTAYHPQTNGLVERTNEVVETALRHYVAPDQKDWNKTLPFIEFALNDAHKDASGTAPFRMNRITVPLTPFEAVKERIATQKDITCPQSECSTWMGVSVPQGERTFLQAQEQFLRARQSVHWAKCKMKEVHDRKGVVNNHYSTGQLVWLSTKHISLRHPSLRHKFSPKFIGPVKVLECSQNGSTVLLDLPTNLQIHPRVSVALVKPFKVRDSVSVQPVWIDGAQEWEVEAIINHNIVSTRSKKKQKFVEFLVQWKGNCEPSWHEFKDCENCIQTVEKYLTQCTKGIRAKIYKALPQAELSWLSDTFQCEALTL